MKLASRLSVLSSMVVLALLAFAGSASAWAPAGQQLRKYPQALGAGTQQSFTRPWRGEEPFLADKGPIYEYACHEGNYGLPNILAGARHDEAAARVKASPAATRRVQ